jgi:alanine racemase
VVKANGYGHGAAIAARAFVAGGASMLAVTTVDEADELRAAGIEAPLMLLASHAADEAEAVIALDVLATVSDLGAGQRLAAAAQRAARTAQAQLLVDAGMGRDGVPVAEAAALHAQLRALPALDVAAVFTHFPTAAARDKGPTRAQLTAFLAAVEAMTPRPAMVHAANSAAAVDLPEARLDLARVGTLLYGQYPSAHVTRLDGLREAWSLRARLVEVRRLSAGATVGYGSTCRLRAPRLVGTLLVGWQHGFTLQPASLASGLRGLRAALRPAAPNVTIGGVSCPVLGRVAMQSCAVDVTDVPKVAVGDVATISCRRVTVERGVPRVAVP